MDSQTLYLLAADVTLLLHMSFVAFVLIGLLLIFVGYALAWSWIRNPWFRWSHLAAITVVVLQSWFGVICPLTTLEMALRSRAGATTYPGAFVAHWLESILYYDAPEWVFAVCYTAFGLLVVVSLFWIRPRPIEKKSSK
ncbi:MAG: DUF2784 domain-containing protein [Gammaproteobacteria bacterium]|nr:DUF2784 domain-containing protein [Gammaproteobacteria bacterium]MDH3373526.1 DUF2784 domain-containing protein [Gammaproteobacteria bacterium]MDH3552663.1 DUF2784 domain-containing protein [Gammaproteobacteria bacterium]